MKKRVVKTRILVVIVITILVSIVWIASEAYFKYTADPLSSQLEIQITPLNPHLPIQILEELEQKRSLIIDLEKSLSATPSSK